MIAGRRATLTDASYPFEFTVPVPAGTKTFDFEVQGLTPTGQAQTSGPASLQR